MGLVELWRLDTRALATQLRLNLSLFERLVILLLVLLSQFFSYLAVDEFGLLQVINNLLLSR